MELFSEVHPDVEVSVYYGNHEELYGLLRSGRADLVLNDQRRAFSDEYVNLILTTCCSYIEVSARSPLAQMEAITPQELKNVPCILVASEAQQETEQEYYHDVVGFQGEFLRAFFRWRERGERPQWGPPLFAFRLCGGRSPSCGITARSGKRSTPDPM